MKTVFDESASMKASLEERRAQERSAIVFRPALIEVGSTACFCLVRNLSASGLMGQVYTHFWENMPVTVHFHSDKAVTGVLLWSKDGKIGVRFDETIDVSKTIELMGQPTIEGKINRGPRVPIHCEGDWFMDNRVDPVQLQDISQNGVKVITAAPVWLGDEGMLRIRGLEPRKAVARWIQNDIVGLQFTRPLGFQELAHWVLEKHGIETAAETSSLRVSG
jgi:hypothetical protein